MRPADVIGAAIKAANSALDLTDQVGSKRWETSGVGPTLVFSHLQKFRWL